MAEPGPADLPAVPLRRNRDFRLLWLGQASSALGTSVSSLAYPLLVLDLTGSAALTGLTASVLAATTFLLRLPAGALVDRWHPRAVLLWCDAGRLVALGSLAAAVAGSWVTLPHVLAVVVAEGTLGVLFAPADAVALRRVVPVEQRMDAVARNEARQQLAGLVGPPVGGALFGLGRALPFLADAVSYAVSFVTVLAIRAPLGRVEPATSGSVRRGLLAGIRWLWTEPFLRAVVVWAMITGGLFAPLGLITMLRAIDLGADAGAIGLLFAVVSAGGLAGALAAPRINRAIRPGVVVIVFGWVATGAALGLLVARSAVVLGLLGGVAFFLVPAVNAIVMGRVATRAPDELAGRAVSATVQLTALLHPVGPVVAGLAVDAFGTARTIAAYATGLGLAALVATALRVIRREPVAPTVR